MLKLLASMGLILCLLAPSASAEPAQDLIHIMEKLFARDLDALNDYISDERVQSIAGDDSIAMSVCDQIAVFIRSITMRAAIGCSVERLRKTCWKIAEGALKLSPESDSAHRAMPAAHLVRARYNLAAGLDPKVEDWLKSSELCLKAAELAEEDEDKLDHIRRAIWRVREAAHCPSVDIDGLYDRAIKICDTHSPGNKQPLIAVERGETRLRKAMLIVSDKKRKKDTIAMVDEAMKELESLRGDKKVGLRAKGLQNQARSLMLENKLGKPEFEMKTRSIGRKRFDVAYPVGSHWDFQGGDGSDHIFTLTRESVDGNFVRIRLYAYSWSTLYTSPNGEVGGDNLKGLMQDDQASDLDKMKKVKKHKKLKKGKLNRSVPKTTGYELSGIDQDGDNWYVRAYLFKLSDYRSSYSLHVSVWVPNPRIDPELKEVLKLFKPLPKK